MPTPTQLAANHLLDGNLDEFVTKRREAGRSWRLIARDLLDETGLDVTHETLRSWFLTAPAEAAS